MKEQQVTQILQEIAEQEVPDNVDLWPAIRTRVQPRRRSPHWAQLMPATRLGWAFLALALFLTFGAVTYAVAPVVSRLFQQEAGLRHVEQASLVQELNLSQTVDGVTVTLERAYADANRIVVGFTIKDPNGQRYDAYHHLTLTDMAGTVFSETIGFGVTGQSDMLQVSLPPGEGAYVLAFDAAPVEGVPVELDLQLVMKLEKFVLPPAALEPPPTPDSPPAEPPMVVVLEPLPTPEEEAIVGPFTFDFSVPFIPGQTVEVQQTEEAAGVAMKLERVVVTPSETRAILCFEPPDDIEWTLVAALDTGEGREIPGGIGSRLGDADKEECHRLSYMGSLTGKSGEWTLTVTELVGTDLSQSQIPSKQIRLAGPWVFRFRVP